MSLFSAEKLTHIRIAGQSSAPLDLPQVGDIELYFDTTQNQLIALDSGGNVIGGGGGGTVTSVAASVPAELSVAGSPVTTSGTLALTWASGTGSGGQGKVIATPSGGGAGAYAGRVLAAGDIPSLSATYQVVSGKNTPGATGYSQLVAAPASAAAAGVAGQIAYDSGFFYVCVATNTWVRAAIATW